MSTRKARRERRKVGMQRITRARRYRGEWEGPWRWERIERTRHISVNSAAIGCTIRRFVNESRAPEGSVKSADGERVAIVELAIVYSKDGLIGGRMDWRGIGGELAMIREQLTSHPHMQRAKQRVWYH